jgi:hypothetical protein
MSQVSINTFAPGKMHSKQAEFLNDPARFKVLRAGRKWRKTSLLISWLFEQALLTGKTCPYIAPNRVQAKNIAWRDHVARMLDELRKKGVPHKVNEVELAVSFPNGGRVQLMGVENKEALRGISNWSAVGGDEVDDWEEDIWPTIIRPNLIVHKAPAIMAGTPKGMKILYNLSQQPEFKEFHYRSHDNPDLDPEELEALVREYQANGEDYYAQEILAEYVKPVGLVYKEWDLSHYKAFEYDPALPLHLTMDFGVNDPTVLVWLQPSPTEVRVLDYYEATDVSMDHYVQVIRSKPYKVPDFVTGDAAGNSRSLTTGTSPIEILASKGIYVKTMDGLRINDQIRKAHTFISRLFVNSEKAERFRDCLLNYRYPTMGVEKRSKLNQENEVPIHDQFSHAMRAFEYWCVNYKETTNNLDREVAQRMARIRSSEDWL